MLVPSLFMLQIFDRVVPSRSIESLTMLAIITVASLLLVGGLETIRSRLATAVGLSIEHRLGPRMLGALLAQTSGHDMRPVSGTLRDVSVLRGFVSGPAMLALMDTPWIPVYLLVIFMLHPLLGAVSLMSALLLLALALATEWLTRRRTIEASEHARRAGRFADSTLRNAETVVGLGMSKSIQDRWAGLSRQLLVHQAQLANTSSLLNGTAKSTRLLVQVLLYVAGAVLVIDQEMTGGAMLAGSILLGRALQPIESLIGTWKSLIESRGAYYRLRQFMASQDKDAAVPTELPAPCGALAAERLALHFPGQELPVVAGVSFELAAGESMGLVGPSAAGKSTLVRLLVGLWSPSSGNLRLDGADIALWPRDRLSPYVGYLPQRVELFPGTVAENIARFVASESESVIEAAQRAHAHAMILRLPKGYDTEIGEGGVVLSGGQAQRIGLARAVFGKPRLVVLDEPNANLDADGETALLQTLRQLKQEGCTVVVVSHRPSILTDVDKMLVLAEGRVQAFGSRQDVMARIAQAAPAPHLHAMKKA